MNILCSDLEGVFVPEIWIKVAEKTGIEELRLTTRDISDYNELMKKRLRVMDQHGLKLKDITDAVASLDPLEGAAETLAWIRTRYQIIVLSDTFEEFAKPLMQKLDFPTLFCHSLVVDADGRITDYALRQQGQKQKAVKALQSLNYRVIAFGDSYNDTDMLKQADTGFFFKPPESILKDFPDFAVTRTYDELKEMITSVI
ncbi:MAG: bifunctional phosphoserine phosphatase/homoserine phosphotransferase ThrH [Desulfobacteraceae bacterium]